MENTNEERNVALNEEQKNNTILDQGIEQIQVNGGISEAAMEADIASESLDSFFYDETEDNNDSPSENEIEAAERAYQEWEEMLDDNQKAEEIIEKNQRKEPADIDVKTNYVLNKLSKAGIEVVTDKEEFDKILASQTILQKMTDDLSKLEELSNQLNEERSKTQKLEQTKEKQEKSIRWNNYKAFVDYIEEAKQYIPVEKDFDTRKNYSTDWYKIANRIPIQFYWDEESVWLVNAEISKGVTTPVIIDRSYTGVRFLSDFESVKQYFDDSHVLTNFQNNIKSIYEKNISLEQKKQTRFADELEKQTNEIKKIEKREAYKTVSDWLYEAEENKMSA